MCTGTRVHGYTGTLVHWYTGTLVHNEQTRKLSRQGDDCKTQTGRRRRRRVCTGTLERGRRVRGRDSTRNAVVVTAGSEWRWKGSGGDGVWHPCHRAVSSSNPNPGAAACRSFSICAIPAASSSADPASFNTLSPTSSSDSPTAAIRVLRPRPAPTLPAPHPRLRVDNDTDCRCLSPSAAHPRPPVAAPTPLFAPAVPAPAAHRTPHTAAQLNAAAILAYVRTALLDGRQ